MSAILSYGYYFPQHFAEEKVLSPASGRKGARRIAYVDEDIITLACEAAYACLGDKKDIDGIFFATTSPVFKNRYHSSFLADMLNLPGGITAMDFGSTPRAGTDALMMADLLVDSGRCKNILVVASEIHFPPIGEESRNQYGHSAVALLVGKNKGIAGIQFSRSFSSGIGEEFIYKTKKVFQDPRFSRDAGFKTNLKSALKESKINPPDYDGVILNSLYAKLAGGIFIKSGFSENQFAKDTLSFSTGYTGSCHALLQLISALENGRKKILLLDYFNGTNILSVESGIKGASPENNSASPVKTFQDYLILRKAGNFNESQYEPVEMFSSEMMNEREKENFLYLHGFECGTCKSVYLLKSPRCKNCKNEKFNSRKLKRTGTVYSLTKEYYFPHAFPPITMAIIDLDEGGRVTVQMTDDMYSEEKNKIQIGSKVKLVLRKMMENSAKPDYFWKCKITAGSS